MTISATTGRALRKWLWRLLFGLTAAGAVALVYGSLHHSSTEATMAEEHGSTALDRLAGRPGSLGAAHATGVTARDTTVLSTRSIADDAATGSCPAPGATDIWTGQAGTSNWTDAGNWSSGKVPVSSDYVCLPQDSAGPVTVPAVTVAEFLSFKDLNLTGNVSAPNGMDLEGTISWQSGTITASTLTFGPSATITITGSVSTSSTTPLTNKGSLRLPSGATLSGGPFVNAGTVDFPGSTGAASLSSIQVVNLAGATVTKSGSAAVASVSAAYQAENDGTVNAPAGGVLQWSASSVPGSGWSFGPGDGVSDGGFGAGGGAGHLDLGPGLDAVSVSAVFAGSGVWVTGTVSGSMSIQAGATVTVGFEPLLANSYVGGTITAPVAGAGTLNVAGYGYNSGNWTTYYATVAGDLNVASVKLSNAQINRKAAGTATVIGSGTTVQIVGGTVQLGTGLSMVNKGVFDFGYNDYFTCSTCSFTNNNDMIIRNPDNAITSFNINYGTFDNKGTIKVEGYLPGRAINFGASANVVRKGSEEFLGLVQPSWIDRIQSSPIVTAASNAFTLDPFGWMQNVGMYLLTDNIGLGRCVNVNADIGIAGATIGACLIVDPDGNEGVAITVAGAATLPVPQDTKDWQLSKMVHGVDFTVDAGYAAFWRTGAAGNKTFHMPSSDNDPSNDVDGATICENGMVTDVVGVVGQHCWGPADGVPFSLDASIADWEGWPGVQMAYVGVSTGEGFSVSSVNAYSVVISCGRWYSLTLHSCPATNTQAPQISGTPAVGQVLSTDNGQWTLSSTISSYTYQWQRCTTSDPTSCTSIGGATNATYTVTAADRGYWIAVSVGAVNNGGTVRALATPVGSVP